MQTIVRALVCAVLASVPAAEASDTLDVATWNIKWFGDSDRDPKDGPQFSGVRDVIRTTQLELWAVQEIEDSRDFGRLLRDLPGYEGFLVRDGRVENGSTDYTWSQQEVGIIYRTDTVTIRGARVVLGHLAERGSRPPFATGRPPLEVVISVPAHDEIVLLILHAKAFSDEDSQRRRQEAAEALHQYILDTWASTPVVVLGDLNDEIDDEGPYAVFANDSREWFAPTADLSGSHESGAMWDHILVSDEAACWYVSDSAEVLSVENASSISDHFPVVASFEVGESCDSP
ncbi:MAG: endonuclease/exonuclease/phosphatase family protein [Acidobacteria bacterium]|nr:endonuclease/exonuclease/phosphatase family protein [Acidobacteriota bacterium]